MLSQLFNRSTAIFRNAWGYRPMARFFATRSSFLCKVCQLRVSHLKGSVQVCAVPPYFLADDAGNSRTHRQQDNCGNASKL